MMPHVDGETSHDEKKNIFLFSLTCFYSRIILRKLNPSQLKCHRKVEKLLNKVIKHKADIKNVFFCVMSFLWIKGIK